MGKLSNILRGILGRKYGWFGNYSSWEEALKDSKGYDNEEIFNKVVEAALKVKRGEAVYERDSVLFHEPKYDWSLFAMIALLRQQNTDINIIDFGGALGSTYFKNKKLLIHLNGLKWNVIEQKNIVRKGIDVFSDEVIYFYDNIEQLKLNSNSLNILLLNCVLPYLENPYNFLEEILLKDFDCIILDRTPVLQKNDRLTIQKVPPLIYKSSYPSWFFNEKKLLEKFKDYDLISIEENQIECNIKEATYKNYIFTQKKYEF